jgi:hypothetical protein
VTATHWYRLGWRAALRVPASARQRWEEHPQSGYLITGGVGGRGGAGGRAGGRHAPARAGVQLWQPHACLLPAGGAAACSRHSPSRPRQPRSIPRAPAPRAGQVIPDFWGSVAALALQAHALLAPGVPLIGWDVALPEGDGPCLLEMNISCNAFNGRYDRWLL